MNTATRNPFDVQTPEHLSAEDFCELFVEESSDHYKLERQGHTFVIGPRGVGKSMIFRFLEPDCMSHKQNCLLKQLPFYGAYIPIKDALLSITELMRLDEIGHGVKIINEHILVNHFCSKITQSLLEKSSNEISHHNHSEEIRSLVNKITTEILAPSGLQVSLEELNKLDGTQSLEWLADQLDRSFSSTSHFLKRTAFERKSITYNGPLFGYKETLEPLIKNIKSLSFMPNGPFYLLIDDADNLNIHQTEILNTWVAMRSTGYLCLKISVQSGKYKTYRTLTGRRINSPHDFSEVDITRLYTTNSDQYLNWVTQITERRLRKCGIDQSATEFFPGDKDQEDKIAEIAKSLKEKHDKGEGRGNRRSDDALRYARSEYIKNLSGKKKSLSTYNYAGFAQLVHISSGVIRHFLEPASLMFSEECTRSNKKTNSIRPTIQNDVIKKYANEFLFDEFDRTVVEEHNDTSDNIDKPTQLRNLIRSLGKMFQLWMLSDMSERKKFSIVVADKLDNDVREILDLGVQHGYFHKSTLGSKEGIGRVPLYILSRRLSPIFTLDPSGFAGYQSITNENLRRAIANPTSFVKQLQMKGLGSATEPPKQQGLFDDQ